jgi:uncharacterized protein
MKVKNIIFRMVIRNLLGIIYGGCDIRNAIILHSMNKSGSSDPLIRAGWLRTLLYAIAFALLVIFALFLYIIWLHSHGGDRNSVQDLLTGQTSASVTVFLFILSLLLTYIFRRWIDRKSLVSLGLGFNNQMWNAIAGVTLAVCIVGAASLILKVTGNLKWTDILFDPRALFLAFGSILLVAVYEELIFRGYILSNLMDSFSKWPALGLSALLFMFFHWNGTSSVGFFPFLNTLIVGLILGLNYIYTRNLWFSISFHAAWKFFERPLLGFPGEGATQTLLQTDLRGDENITGGAGGLEGSYIFMVISLLSLIALYFILQKKLSLQSQPVPGQI